MIDVSFVYLLDQPGNMLRYPLPPHLMLPHAVQRQALHGSYGFPVSLKLNVTLRKCGMRDHSVTWRLMTHPAL